MINSKIIGAYLASALSNPEPATEALLIALLPEPCSREAYWMLDLLMSLGLDRNLGMEAPQFDLSAYNFQRLAIDVDQDNEKEIVLFGGGQDNSIFAGVLDWDGAKWQVAWVDRRETRYSGNIRVQADDFDNDGKVELLIEILTHPASGTGVLYHLWEVNLLSCKPLHCDLIWTYPLAENNQIMSSYERINSEYHFLESSDASKGDLEVLRYGITFNRPYNEELRRPELESISVLTTTRTTFAWNGEDYVPTDAIVLKPAHILSGAPLTESVDFDGDGTLEHAVYGWSNADEQTLSIYQQGEETWHLTQVFSTPVTGSEDTGILLADFDADALVDIFVCQTAFARILSWDNSSEWPAMQPNCKIYEWSPNTQSFQFIGARD